MRDNRSVGFSRRYTVSMWVGNSSGAPIWAVSGVTGAAPVWRTLVDALHTRDGAAVMALPARLVQRTVRFEAAIEPPRDDWFIAGTEQTLLTSAAAKDGKRLGQACSPPRPPT